MENMKNRTGPYIRQFYRGNGWRFVLAIFNTAAMTACNIMISWLLQQIVDMATDLDVGFSFA